MERISRFLLLFLWLCSCIPALAQSTLRIRSLDGLMENVVDVEKVMQDSHGFIWVSSSSGLFRYDGYSFVQFRMDGLGHSYLDVNDNIWCIAGQTVYIFDTDKCEYIDVLKKFIEKTKQKIVVQKIRTLQNGQIWLICDGNVCLKINAYRPEDNISIVHFDAFEKIETLFADKVNNTWVLTDKKTIIISPSSTISFKTTIRSQALVDNRIWVVDTDGNLDYYSYNSNKLFRYLPLNNHEITKLKKFPSGKVLAFTSKESYLIDKKGKIIAKYGCLDSDAYYEDSQGKMYCFDNVKLYFEDNFHKIWVITKNGELQYVDKSSSSLFTYEISGLDIGGLKQSFTDIFGNLWLFTDLRIYVASSHFDAYKLLPDYSAHTRTIFRESNNRFWISERYEPFVRVYNSNKTLQGFLGSDGKITSSPSKFFARVYKIFEDSRGIIWIGTKPKGLFRLVPANKNKTAYKITNYMMESTNNTLSFNEVVSIDEDKFGRLWLGTFGGGVNCIENPEDENPRILNSENCFTSAHISDPKIKNVHVSKDGFLYVTTSSSFSIADICTNDLKNMTFVQYLKDDSAKFNLAPNSIASMKETSSGDVFICTQSSGVIKLCSNNSSGKSFSYSQYNSANGLPSDLCQVAIEHNKSIWVVASNQLYEINEKKRVINSFLANEGLLFASSQPVLLADGTWLFGLHSGCANIDLDKINRKTGNIPIHITSVQIQNEPIDYSYTRRDTIVLKYNQRDVNITFAALHFSSNPNVNYSYMLEGRNNEWISIGKTNNVLFVDLAPKTYKLKLRSTNSEGAWADNVRTVTIIVTPTFWETGWAILLYVLILLLIAYIAYRIRSYINRIKKQQKDTLEAYLRLIDNYKDESRKHETRRKQLLADAKIESQNDAIIKRIMEFIDSHLQDADVNIDDMAAAAFVSKSLLHVKIKKIFGITPGRLIAEARIQKACNLLADDNLSIIEVAFACGFSDPKYFSRCFKKETGDTPTEYRLKL